MSAEDIFGNVLGDIFQHKELKQDTEAILNRLLLELHRFRQSAVNKDEKMAFNTAMRLVKDARDGLKK